VEETAARLLRAMGDQVKGKSTREVAPWEAAESIGIRPHSREYDRLVSHLLDSGYIKLLIGMELPSRPPYLITDAGLAKLRELELPPR
jgi:hypothetical protein